jgi:N-terminal 7TM region of histidine kinase
MRGRSLDWRPVLFYPLLATVVSAAFAATLFGRYRGKRRPFLLAWAVALALYAVAALTEVIGAAAGWTPLLYRTYYFFGAIILVGTLALGTIYLLAPRYSRAALWILVVLAAIGLAGVLGAELQAARLDTHQVPDADTIRAQGGPFNLVAILMAALINLTGSVILIGGALWSAYGAARRGGAASRVLANVLIAAGALIVAGASSLTRVFHVYEVFYVGQAVGVIVMFGGFLTAERAPRRLTQSLPAS